MIAQAKQSTRPELTVKHQRHFATAMLPTIQRIARQSFSHLDQEAKQEAVAEVVAVAFIMYVSLVRDGREAVAYATVLAEFSLRRVRSGRLAATAQNIRDVSSLFCQLNKGITVEQLDRSDRDSGQWLEVLVEDKTAGPAEIAASRIDVGDWMAALPKRDRRIAETLSIGETTGNAARKFRVSPGRVSQLRRELKDSWEQFVGEAPVAQAAVTAVT